MPRMTSNMSGRRTCAAGMLVLLMAACGGGGGGGTGGPADPEPVPAGAWTPAVSDTWQWQLKGTVNTSYAVTVYDPKTPQIWRVPFRKNTKPSLVVTAPRGGYIVPPGYASEIGAKLQLHDIEFRKLEALGRTEVECFRASQVEFSAAPFEGRTRATIAGAWQKEQQEIGAGSLFVPIAQIRSRLAMVLLEPQAPASFAAWGFFNSWFEHKEYVEPYVIEIMAQDLMKADPSLAAEFERKLKEDPAFAADPAARREFFYRRHAAWDARFGLYPIMRVASVR